MDRMLKDKEVQEILGISRTTLYRIRKQQGGKLRARRINGRIGYLESEVLGYLETLPVVDVEAPN